MERRAVSARLDPALAVSGLLTRLALFFLVVLAPVVAMFSRRAVSILVPVATALLILAAVLDGHLPKALGRFGRLLIAPPALALIALIVWAAVTHLWTPQPVDAAGRLTQFALSLGLFAGAIACMPDRTRRSDVNLIPIGTAIGALALALSLLPNSPLGSLLAPRENVVETQRAAMLLALLVWPSVASLIVQHRSPLGVVLYATCLAALWLAKDLVVLASAITGTLAFLICLWRPRGGTLVVGGVTLAMLILAPLAGWLMSRYGGFLLPHEGDALVGVWRDVTYSLPSHLLHGFGFDASTALARGDSGVILGSPRNAALQIWLELGLVGVAIAAVALALMVMALERVDEKARPAAMAVAAAAATMMYAGPAAWQSWWITELGLTAVSLAFLARQRMRERR